MTPKEDIMIVSATGSLPDIQEGKVTAQYEDEGFTFIAAEVDLVTTRENPGIRGTPVYNTTTAWINRPDMTQELLERIKHIEDMLSNISEANKREMEEHEKWENAFDAQLDVMDKGLDEFEKLASEFGDLEKKEEK